MLIVVFKMIEITTEHRNNVEFDIWFDRDRHSEMKISFEYCIWSEKLKKKQFREKCLR